MDNKFKDSNFATSRKKRLIQGETVVMERPIGSNVDTTLRITKMLTNFNNPAVSLELHHILKSPLKVKDFTDENGDLGPLRSIVSGLMDEFSLDSRTCGGSAVISESGSSLEDILYQKLLNIFLEHRDDMEFYIRLGKRISTHFFKGEDSDDLDISGYRDIMMEVEESILEKEEGETYE